MSSENVETLKYDDVCKTLTITYRGGSIWEYAPVSQEAFAKVVAVVHELTRCNFTVGVKVT